MLTEDGRYMIAYDGEPVCILHDMACRHGLVAGATGTGKTITLKVLAETFSQAGVPVFIADIKGDVSGIAMAGDKDEAIISRAESMGIDGFTFQGCPTRFWDVSGEKGIPIRTTIKDMGPSLLSRVLDLSDVQEGVLDVAFRVSGDEGIGLADLDDLRALLQHLLENSRDYSARYGSVALSSIGAIQRSILKLENAGGASLFGEPSVDIMDWIQCADDGRGYVNVLDSTELALDPLLYSTFMLWMLTEIYSKLPEVGEVDKPKIVFIFDEAHLLFNDTSKAMRSKVEQVVRLIRSKGVGVYLCTQSPSDIDEPVLAQLGNRIQHGLRAYTPNEMRKVKAAADSFRSNPDIDTESVIQELRTGEALVSFLDEDGAPGIVRRVRIVPPMCRMKALPKTARDTYSTPSPWDATLFAKYRKAEKQNDDHATSDFEVGRMVSQMVRIGTRPITDRRSYLDRSMDDGPLSAFVEMSVETIMDGRMNRNGFRR